METDHILRLLQKCLSEGQPEDWQQLRKELARGGQEQVQKELFLLGELKPEDLKADPEKLWRQIAACRAEGRTVNSDYRKDGVILLLRSCCSLQLE